MDIKKDVSRKNPFLFIYGISRIENVRGYRMQVYRNGTNLNIVKTVMYKNMKRKISTLT